MIDVKTMTRLAVVAALYVVFTIYNPFSYRDIQFRVSEILVLLAFYRKDYSIALILGCAIANLFSPYGIVDVIFGTLATAITVYLIMVSKNLFIASLFPALVNGVIIGLEIYFLDEIPVLVAMSSVALGEFVVVSIFGFITFKILERNHEFMKIIGANQNIKKI